MQSRVEVIPPFLSLTSAVGGSHTVPERKLQLRQAQGPVFGGGCLRGRAIWEEPVQRHKRTAMVAIPSVTLPLACRRPDSVGHLLPHVLQRPRVVASCAGGFRSRARLRFRYGDKVIAEAAHG